jgi:hypothetical protein
MLLIDRILAAVNRVERRREPASRDEVLLAMQLKEAVPYELTAVVPMLGDWLRDRSKPIPKRPPHLLTWAEWATENDGQRNRFGALVIEIESAIGKEEYIRHSNASADRTRTDVKERWWDGGLPDDVILYAVHGFMMIERGESGKLGLWCPAYMWHMNAYAFRRTGEYVGNTIHFDESPDRPYVLDLPFAIDTFEYLRSAETGFWPPFMAFSLLHCKNVVTTSHGYTEQDQRRVRKSGNPPRVTYKTIQLKVPETLKAKGPGGHDEDAEGSVRFHLCRGHFKNLTHPKYKQPGLHWWPAHWRGNPEQGVVISDRAMVPADPTR